MDYKQEIESIRGQMASDFQFITLGMKDMGLTFRSGMEKSSERMNDLARETAALGREMEEGFNQLEGRMRLQEQRFSRILVVVEGAVDGWRPEIEEVKARLDRLEDRLNSAA